VLRHSLRGKITIGYYVVAAIILVASLFFVGELRTLEQRVILGQRVTDLFDTVLEIRRFERNYFLYRQTEDRDRNHHYITLARDLLTHERADFLAIAPARRLDQLLSLLQEYQNQMSAYAAVVSDRSQAATLEPQVRSLGKEVVAIAQDMAGSERRQIQIMLATLRSMLLVVILSLAVLIIAIGRGLSQRVVRPLKEMEASVEAISTNQKANLAPPSNDREIVSIIEAFNRMLKELDLRQKSLMRSERLVSLGTMLSGVAHELNNPLSNISSSCQILQEEVGESDLDSQKRFLAQIDQQTVRARNIVRSLLDFAREKDFKKEPVRLRPLVEQTVGFVRGKVPAKSVVQVQVPDELQVPADAQGLQQVFVNLIRNAMEGLDAHGQIVISARQQHVSGPPIDTALGEGCDYEGEVVEISVADNGPGIAPEILSRIFDPFFTTKNAGHDGMGLGLFVVYKIVDEHGGCISVHSAPGAGATFHIRLPQTIGEGRPAEAVGE
jgi:two-component system NtrC family sensor kinase